MATVVQPMTQAPIQYVDQYGNPISVAPQPQPQVIQYVDQYGNPITAQPQQQYVVQNAAPATQPFVATSAVVSSPSNAVSGTNEAEYQDTEKSKSKWDRFGDTPCEKIMCGLSLLLFIFGIMEMPALVTYATAFGRSTSDGCCGLISEKSSTFDGAVCHERDILNGTIEKMDINESIVCVLDGNECLDYTFKVSRLDAAINASQAMPYYSLPACLDGGGFQLYDLCNKDNLKYHVQEQGAGQAVMWCWMAFAVTLITSLCDMGDFAGWFKQNTCCQKKGTQTCLKICGVLVWALILAALTTEVENPAANGYESDTFYLDSDVEDRFENRTYNAREMVNESYADLVTPEWYVESVCGMDSSQILWIDYDIDVPGWVQSDWYGVLAILGIVLSVLEMTLFFMWSFCGCCQKKEEYPQTKQAIELAGN